MGEALSDSQVRETRQIAQLEVRAYFDHYLTVVVPAQQRAAREHTHLMIEAHDSSHKAHGGVERRFNKLVWMMLGAATAGGGAGAGLVKLLGGL